MPCPFPGMDPYIERSDIWPDFHDSLITFIRSALQPLLRPRYVALTQERLYVVESDRPIRPDVAVVGTGAPGKSSRSATALMEPDAPAIFELWHDEIREPYITILEPAAGNRLVTAIEVLSPDNKVPGPGRNAYLKKREEFWGSATNLVEIDLLRQGDPTVRVAADKLESLRPWHYLAAVTRYWPTRQEIYAMTLQQRLRPISIPLAHDDSDVKLELQAVFTRCWEEGPYPELLHYSGPPPVTMTKDEIQWCEDLLKKAKCRT